MCESNDTYFADLPAERTVCLGAYSPMKARSRGLLMQELLLRLNVVVEEISLIEPGFYLGSYEAAQDLLCWSLSI